MARRDTVGYGLVTVATACLANGTVEVEIDRSLRDTENLGYLPGGFPFADPEQAFSLPLRQVGSFLVEQLVSLAKDGAAQDAQQGEIRQFKLAVLSTG